jgi:hypothetical protein
VTVATLYGTRHAWSALLAAVEGLKAGSFEGLAGGTPGKQQNRHFSQHRLSQTQCKAAGGMRVLASGSPRRRPILAVGASLFALGLQVALPFAGVELRRFDSWSCSSPARHSLHRPSLPGATPRSGDKLRSLMMSTRRFGIGAAVAAVSLLAGVSCGGSPAKGQDAAPKAGGSAHSGGATQGEALCFNAVADGKNPAQAVFDELGREGNGETWYAILNHVLRERARVGEPVSVPAMEIGEQFSVEFQNRKSWVGFDVEAGTALFCSGDPVILALLRDLYIEARDKPELLRTLVKAVPDSEWDD